MIQLSVERSSGWTLNDRCLATWINVANDFAHSKSLSVNIQTFSKSTQKPHLQVVIKLKMKLSKLYFFISFLSLPNNRPIPRHTYRAKAEKEKRSQELFDLAKCCWSLVTISSGSLFPSLWRGTKKKWDTFRGIERKKGLRKGCRTGLCAPFVCLTSGVVCCLIIDNPLTHWDT